MNEFSIHEMRFPFFSLLAAVLALSLDLISFRVRRFYIPGSDVVNHVSVASHHTVDSCFKSQLS